MVLLEARAALCLINPSPNTWMTTVTTINGRPQAQLPLQRTGFVTKKLEQNWTTLIQTSVNRVPGSRRQSICKALLCLPATRKESRQKRFDHCRSHRYQCIPAKSTSCDQQFCESRNHMIQACPFIEKNSLKVFSSLRPHIFTDLDQCDPRSESGLHPQRDSKQYTHTSSSAN